MYLRPRLFVGCMYLRAAFIRGPRLFVGCMYLRAAFICGLYVFEAAFICGLYVFEGRVYLRVVCI